MDAAIWSFAVLMVLLTCSGAMSWIKKKKTTGDYLLASRGVAPWLSALSAVATNNSGFMFIGMIAYSYRLGIESMWMMIGWILGDLSAWLLVHPRVRRQSEKKDVNSLAGLMGTGDGSQGSCRLIVLVSGLITVIFLGIYAAAQLKAGSTALRALFGWDVSIGMTIGAAIVVLYSFAGGIRADIWTDAAQSLVMIITMILIMVMGMQDIGGPQVLWDNLKAQDPGLISVFPEEPAFGFLAYLLGMVAGGYGTTGQPHIMTRYMAIESADKIKRAGCWYFAWYIPFFIASVAVGLYTRALMPDLPQHELAQEFHDPTELALPLVTMHLLPDVFIGVALAGLFAATVSTADSQIIVCSGAITQDIRPRWRDSYLASKTGTFSITAVALLIGLYAPEGVFGLVLIAWSALAASLGSVLVIRLWGLPLSNAGALAMMITGIVVVSWWHVSGYDDDVFKLLPGLIAAFAVYGLSRLIDSIKGESS